jgi:hypothetical protein
MGQGAVMRRGLRVEGLKGGGGGARCCDAARRFSTEEAPRCLRNSMARPMRLLPRSRSSDPDLERPSISLTMHLLPDRPQHTCRGN